jgi:hypothetical protein
MRNDTFSAPSFREDKNASVLETRNQITCPSQWPHPRGWSIWSLACDPNRLIVLLPIKAGLRVDEISKLTWEMVLDPSGRLIPVHAELREALSRGEPMLPIGSNATSSPSEIIP